jgi:hypothetical protein
VVATHQRRGRKWARQGEETGTWGSLTTATDGYTGELFRRGAVPSRLALECALGLSSAALTAGQGDESPVQRDHTATTRSTPGGSLDDPGTPLWSMRGRCFPHSNACSILIPHSLPRVIPTDVPGAVHIPGRIERTTTRSCVMAGAHIATSCVSALTAGPSEGILDGLRKLAAAGYERVPAPAPQAPR